MTYETGRMTSADPSDVATRDDFADFLGAVLADFRSSGESEWENTTLEGFWRGSPHSRRRGWSIAVEAIRTCRPGGFSRR